MPVLSVDYSRGAATTLLIKDDFSYRILRIPLMSPDIYYAHQKSNSQIFENYLKLIEENFSIKLTPDTKLFVSTVKDFGIKHPPSTFCDKSEAFKSLSGIDFIYFGHLHVGSNQGVFSADVSYDEILQELHFDEGKQVIINYFENLALYPFIQPSSDRDFYEEEAYLKTIAKKKCQIVNTEPFEQSQKFIFSTTRSLDDELSLCRFMLLCSESLCTEGIYEYQLDQFDFVGASAALSLLDNKTFQRLEFPEFLTLGTVLNIQDNINCVITDPTSERVEFNLRKGEIFTYPLSDVNKVTLEIKSENHGPIVKELRGGVFGLVIDTREKTKSGLLNIDQRKRLIKSWEDSLLHSMKGL